MSWSTVQGETCFLPKKMVSNIIVGVATLKFVSFRKLKKLHGRETRNLLEKLTENRSQKVVFTYLHIYEKARLGAWFLHSSLIKSQLFNITHAYFITIYMYM